MCILLSYTGTHGTGKTTAARLLAHLVKRRHPERRVGLIHSVENACPYPIDHESTPESQTWIFSTQLSRELTLARECDVLVTDRTILDSVAYTMATGMEPLACRMRSMAEAMMHRYARVRFRQTATNPYHIDDGARDMDPVWRLEVEAILLALYEEIGLREPIDRFQMV